MFYKFGSIAALIAALATPASAAGHGMHHARAQLNCPQTVMIMFTPWDGFCGGRFWVRDPQSGKMTTTPFWRLKLRQDRPDDHP
jgi:hypothetical protein